MPAGHKNQSLNKETECVKGFVFKLFHVKKKTAIPDTSVLLSCKDFHTCQWGGKNMGIPFDNLEMSLSLLNVFHFKYKLN